jgi:nucleotide-binding universal stress UspA family protein
MSRILLVLSTTRYSRASVNHAIDEARELLKHGSVSMRVLYIIETGELAKVRSSIDGDGWLGDQPQGKVIDALARQHHKTARHRIQRARKLAAELEGLELTVDEVEGNYKDEASQAALDGDVDLVFMTRADKPFITRFLFGSEAETVARLVREGGGRVVINDSIV